MAKATYTTIEGYYLDYNISSPYLERLEELRKLGKKLYPEAIEKISWGMPTLNYHGYLFQYAACKGYVGFYVGPDAIAEHAEQLSTYKTTKAAIHLPIDKPYDYPLLESIIHFCANDNIAFEKNKEKKK